jgi:hypothetical protein
VFSASVSPYATVEAIDTIIKSDASEANNIGKNCLSVLKRFELITVKNNVITVNSNSIKKYGGTLESIWSIAKNERSLIKCIEILEINPSISVKELAEMISSEFGLNWSDGSKTRNGRALRQWSIWVKEGIETSSIPIPPGRPNKMLQRTV